MQKPLFMLFLGTCLLSCNDIIVRDQINTLSAKQTSDEVYLDDLFEEKPKKARSLFCKYGFEEGGPVARDILKSEDLKKLKFNKPINLKYINSLLGSSLKNTLDFLQTDMGMYVARVEVDAIEFGCLNKDNTPRLHKLPLYNDHFKKVWFEEGYHKRPVAGTYFAADDKKTRSFTKTPSILFNPYTSKWTVLHEFMHHLFKLEDKKAAELHENYEKSEKELKVAYQVFKQHRFNQAVIHFKNYFDGIIYSLKAVPLEEVAIESFLLAKLDSGELQVIEPGQKEMAFSYALDNAQKVLDILDFIDDWFLAFKGIDLTHDSLDTLMEIRDEKDSLRAVATKERNRFLKLVSYHLKEEATLKVTNKQHGHDHGHHHHTINFAPLIDRKLIP